MPTFTLNRRSVLRGLVRGALVSVALPPLEAMLGSTGEAFADGTAPPRRFGLWFFGNGVQLDRWVLRPAAGETPPAVRSEWWRYLSPGSSLEVFQDADPARDVRDYLSVVSGTPMSVNTGSVHNEGRSAMMTGSFDIAIGQYGSATLPSADQLMARVWAPHALSRPWKWEYRIPGRISPSRGPGARARPGAGVSYRWRRTQRRSSTDSSAARGAPRLPRLGSSAR